MLLLAAPLPSLLSVSASLLVAPLNLGRGVQRGFIEVAWSYTDLGSEPTLLLTNSELSNSEFRSPHLQLQIKIPFPQVCCKSETT